MIGDEMRLMEVIDEIEPWTLQQRRAFIASIERAYGPAAANQIKNELARRWAKR